MFELSDQKQKLLKTDGHILVLGGPGSGKTTIALLKAKEIVESNILKSKQHVLFLSFARATVTRVEQQAGILIPQSIRSSLEFNTYHGFTWNLLRSHGYLLNVNSPLKLLSPPEAASRLADFPNSESREAEKERLFREEGLLHFDLFAPLSYELLLKSKSLAKIMCNAYPVIILDEFQDTNVHEWNLITLLGTQSNLITLADADQRIYEFRGADPARIGDFINSFNPSQYDFGKENNRSNGTDIVQYGNDLLSGANKGKSYNDVKCLGYKFRKGLAKHFALKCEVLKAYKRLTTNGSQDWSLAILVPTKNLMLEVSSYLESKQQFANNVFLPSISHDVALEKEGPSLAAVLIAGLLEGGESDEQVEKVLVYNLCEHIRGRKGERGPTKAELGVSSALLSYIETGKIRGSKRQFIVSECRRLANQCRAVSYVGDPFDDWRAIQNILFDSECDFIKQVVNDARYLRLLHKGALLRSSLADIWRNNGNYSGAVDAVRNALTQEHFATSTKVWKGINVMTMHKAKGKEFDEVIIYEGYYYGKIVRDDASTREIDQSRLKLRVAVTRARSRVTILSPQNQPCMFL